MEIKAISAEDFERMTTDKWKACVGCQYLSKEKGSISRLANPEDDAVYHCGLGQVEIGHNFGKLPEQCRVRNMNKENAHEQRYMFQPEKKVRNNCAICKTYKASEALDTGKPCQPWCESKRIVFGFCPCKECDKFMASATGCKSETSKCGELCKYEVR